MKIGDIHALRDQKRALLIACFRYFTRQIRGGGVPRVIDDEPVLVIALKLSALEILESAIAEYDEITKQEIEERKKNG